MYALQIQSIVHLTTPYIMELGELSGILDTLTSLETGSEQFNIILARPRVRTPDTSQLELSPERRPDPNFLLQQNLGR